MKTITLKNVRDDWEACYEPDRLTELFNRPCTPIEVLTRADGAWASVPNEDRLWVVLRPRVLPAPVAWLFTAWCARRAMQTAGDDDSRSLAVIETVERYAEGDDESPDAMQAAWEAADEAAEEADEAAREAGAEATEAREAGARAVARRAAWVVSRGTPWAAWAAAEEAARAAALAASLAAQAAQAAQADQAARAEQVRQLAELLSESETS